MAFYNSLEKNYLGSHSGQERLNRGVWVWSLPLANLQYVYAPYSSKLLLNEVAS